MNASKRIVAIVILLICGMCGCSYITGFNLVIPLSKPNSSDFSSSYIKTGNNIDLFSRFDFSKDDWVAYIVLSVKDRTDLDPQIKKQSCLKTSDRHLLQQMGKNWKFKVSNGDVATVSNSFYLFRNGRLVFESGIVLDKQSQGLQNEHFGWMQPVPSNDMVAFCKQFKPVYWPVTVL